MHSLLTPPETAPPPPPPPPPFTPRHFHGRQEAGTRGWGARHQRMGDQGLSRICDCPVPLCIPDPHLCIPNSLTFASLSLTTILCTHGRLNLLQTTAASLLQLHQHSKGETSCSSCQPVVPLQVKEAPCRSGQPRKACPVTWPTSAGMMKLASGCWTSSMSPPRKANSRYAGRLKPSM